jgi:predicted DNA-binding transcriptional regulator YafY
MDYNRASYFQQVLYRGSTMYHPTTRVLTVLELLQSRQRITGPELAERLEVNIRTARRYITMLQDLGLPIEAERGRYGAYRLRPGFKLPPLMFTEEEALAITIGLLASRRMGLVVAAPTIEGALVKLERVLPPAMRERVNAVQESLIMEFRHSRTTPATHIILDLSTAVQEQRRIRLNYQSWSGTNSEREFDPYALVYLTGYWYMVGFCQLRSAMRLLRLDRIQSMELLDTHFQAPSNLDAVAFVNQALAQTPGTWTIEVILNASLEEAQKRVTPGYANLSQHDDGILMRCHHDDLDYIARSLISLALPFRVLQPPELQTKLSEIANELLQSIPRPS